MSINLTEFERGEPFVGDVAAVLAALHERLARLQLAQIVHRRRAIIVFEGWPDAGKDALRRLTGMLDPCHATTHATPTELEDSDERHWLAPFWGALPRPGHTTIFYRSWYARLLLARMGGANERKAFLRACDEVNEFESQQRDHGTLIIKLFFHVTEEVQRATLDRFEADSWRRHTVGPSDQRSLGRRNEITGVLHDIFAQTDTRWAPWRLIDANDVDAAAIAALGQIVELFDAAMPTAPPGEAEVIEFPNGAQRHA